MPSSNKTSLGLNQWVGSDKPKREDFNKDNEIVNNQLSAKANLSGATFSGSVTGTRIISRGNNQTAYVALICNGDSDDYTRIYSVSADGDATSTLIDPKTGGIWPTKNGTGPIGQYNYRYSTGFFSSDISVSSDAKQKHEVCPLDNRYVEFVLNVPVVSYKYNNGTSDRTHSGFIAQEVEKVANEVGIETKDFAAVMIDVNEETGKEEYSLRYGELIAPLYCAVQRLSQKIEYLEGLLEK